MQKPLHHPLLALDKPRVVYQSFGLKRDQEFGNRHNRRIRDQRLWVHSVWGRGQIWSTPADVTNSTGIASRGPKGSLWYTRELFRCFRELTKYTCVAAPTVRDRSSRDMNCVVRVGGARVSSRSRGKAMWVTVEEDCSILCEEVQVVHTLAAICQCISSFTRRRTATNWGFSHPACIRRNVKCLEAAGKECGGEARDRPRGKV